MDQIYQEQILDHAKNPRNKGEILDYSCKTKGNNPSCGDNMELFLKIVNKNLEEENNEQEFKKKKDNNFIIENSSFMGEGCALSMAGASMLTERLKNMKIEEVKNIMPGDIYDLLGINISPSRVGCALLCYRALEQALKECDKIDLI